MDAKEKPVCRYCGSDDVVADGTARWDAEKQEWLLSGTFDGGTCGACGEENKYFNWENVDG